MHASPRDGPRWLGIVAIALALLAWELLNVLRIVPASLLPGPAEVFHTFLSVWRDGYRNTTLLENSVATLYRAGAGFGLAAVIGIPLGLAMGYNRAVHAALDFIIQFMRPLPPLSYLILLILWLGTGDGSKIALLYLTAFPILVTSAAAGVRGVKLEKISAAQSLGADAWQVFRLVIFPSALPTIFTGIRIGVAVTFSTVVAAELMAATNGLGWMVISASKFLRNDIIMLGIILLGILGVILSKLIELLDRKLVHWRGVE